LKEENVEFTKIFDHEDLGILVKSDVIKILLLYVIQSSKNWSLRQLYPL